MYAKTTHSTTKYFKDYYVTFIASFYGNEFEEIEEVIYVDRKSGNWMDISNFMYDFLSDEDICEIETEIINS